MGRRQQLETVPGYGKRLRARLRSAQLRQVELARAAQLSRQTIANALEDRVSQRSRDRIDDVLRSRSGTEVTGNAEASDTTLFGGRPRSDTLVTATDLIHWSDRRESQGELPRLIRRLASITNPTIHHLSFRAGDGINVPGPDGIVEATSATAFVPTGYSVWELGTASNPQRKANHDYHDRTQAEGSAVSDRTFVFVTSRRWREKVHWVAEKAAEGAWKDVKVLDADDLEAWMESAPSVHLWFSLLAGSVPLGVQDLDRWWRNWRAATGPALSRAFVLAGRKEAQESVEDWIANPSAPLGIHAESREEAVAVFAAVIEGLSDDVRDAVSARAVVVEDISAWRHLAISRTPLIFIPLFDADGVLSSALEVGHAVVIPLGHGDAERSGVVTVPPIARASAVDALEAAGVDRDRSWSYASLARRSMTAFRRTIAVAPTMRVPAWAQPTVGRSLLPALLVPRWNDGHEGDRRIIESLGQANYDEIAERLSPWTRGTDPALRHRLAIWYLVSPEDAFRQLRRFLNGSDVKRFSTAALEVLSQIDARLDLPQEKRWMAGILLEKPEYSAVVRAAMAGTLALFGSRGEPRSSNDRYDASEGMAEQVVGELLNRANADFRIWQSLGDCLPDLAEAAPDAVLSALERELQRNDEPLRRIFMDQEGGGSFSVSSPHTGFLWALERLAWSAELLPRVIRVLGELDRIDPGGRLANRPLRSLRSIFLPWHPQTGATVEQRIGVLESWVRDQPEAAWKVLVTMLPELHGVGEYTNVPHWRDWKPDSRADVTHGDIAKCVAVAVRLLLKLVGLSGTRWRELIEALPMLPSGEHEAILAHLHSVDANIASSDDRVAIWGALRALVADHRSMPDAEWVMPQKRIDAIDRLRLRFEPTDVVTKYGWLFSWHARLPDATTTSANIGEYQAEIEQHQRTALAEIAAAEGPSSVLKIVEVADNPQAVGFVAGQINLFAPNEDELLKTHLPSADRKMARFAFGYIAGQMRGRGDATGPDWVRSTFVETAGRWPAAARAELLQLLEPDRETWILAEGAGEAVERAYWEKAWVYRVPSEDAEEAARQLIRFGNALGAVELVGMQLAKASFPSVLMIEVLEAALQSLEGGSVPGSMFAHNVERILDTLADLPDADEVRIGRLEWEFLPIVTRHDRTPRMLSKVLVREPRLFVEAVCLAYRAEGNAAEVHDGDGSVDGDDERAGDPDNRAYRAHSLLHSIRSIPGTGADGQPDSEALRAWVDTVTCELQRHRRFDIGVHQIGQMLGAIKVFDADGTWPCTAVRDLIDGLKSDNLERGFSMGLYNSRGVIMRSPTAGGGSERALAERYSGFAAVVKHRWPRTAELLQRIAAGYRAEARHEDQSVELDEDLGS